MRGNIHMLRLDTMLSFISQIKKSDFGEPNKADCAVKELHRRI